MTADALVLARCRLYFLLVRKVSWPGPASSIVERPVISISGLPFNWHSRCAAISPNFIIGSRGSFLNLQPSDNDLLLGHAVIRHNVVDDSQLGQACAALKNYSE